MSLLGSLVARALKAGKNEYTLVSEWLSSFSRLSSDEQAADLRVVDDAITRESMLALITARSEFLSVLSRALEWTGCTAVQIYRPAELYGEPLTPCYHVMLETTRMPARFGPGVCAFALRGLVKHYHYDNLAHIIRCAVKLEPPVINTVRHVLEVLASEYSEASQWSLFDVAAGTLAWAGISNRHYPEVLAAMYPSTPSHAAPSHAAPSHALLRAQVVNLLVGAASDKRALLRSLAGDSFGLGREIQAAFRLWHAKEAAFRTISVQYLALARPASPFGTPAICVVSCDESGVAPCPSQGDESGDESVYGSCVIREPAEELSRLAAKLADAMREGS